MKRPDKISDTLHDLSSQAFYKMPEQITIDLIEDAEQLLFEDVNRKLSEKIGAHIYKVNNVLKVLDSDLEWDKELLTKLKDVLNEWKEHLDWAHKIMSKARPK